MPKRFDGIELRYRGMLGELRMRLAPAPDLDRARDVLLMDSPKHGGPDAGDLHVIVHADTALLLFRSSDLFGLRIAADGSFGAVKL